MINWRHKTAGKVRRGRTVCTEKDGGARRGGDVERERRVGVRAGPGWQAGTREQLI